MSHNKNNDQACESIVNQLLSIFKEREENYIEVKDFLLIKENIQSNKYKFEQESFNLF